MAKKKAPVLVALAFLAGMASTAQAATGEEMFADVPEGHWAYRAVSELKEADLIRGFGSESFNGDEAVTRYQMAQLVATALAHEDEATSTEQVTIEKLRAEFEDEIKAIEDLRGRVKKLEHKTEDFVKIHGGMAQKFQKSYYGNGEQGKPGYWWEKSFDVYADAKIPKTGIEFHAAFNTKLGNGEHNGFNSETVGTEDYNGGQSRSNRFRIDKIYLEGDLGKTGQHLKVGLVEPWLQNGFVTDAVIKGVTADHFGKDYAIHVFGGKLDTKDWDLGVGADIGDYISSKDGMETHALEPGNKYGDFVRAHADTVTYPTGGVVGDNDRGSDNAYDYSKWGFSKTDKYLYGIVYDRTFSKLFDGSLGFYRYNSAAYMGEPLYIGAMALNYHFAKNLNILVNYGQGSQHGPHSHPTAHNIELQYRPNCYTPHLLSGYIGYRYIGPDAIVKTNYGDDVGAGKKGLVIGFSYNFTPTLNASVKYGWGHSITNNNLKRNKLYTCLSLGF